MVNNKSTLAEYYIIQYTDYTDAYTCADTHIRTRTDLRKEHLFTDLETTTERLDQVTPYEEAEILSVTLDADDNIISINTEEY